MKFVTERHDDVPLGKTGMGDRIKLIVRLLGGAATAAKIVNRSPMQITRYAKGHEPPASVLIGLARAAQVSLDWLATGQGIAPSFGLSSESDAGSILEPRRGREGLRESPSPTYICDQWETHAASKDQVQFVPHYAAQLHTGDGGWIDRARLIRYVPFSHGLLLRCMGKDNWAGLAVFAATDDTMAPTIQAEDLLLIDSDATNLSDGVFAFIHGNACRVKRFRFRLDGTVDVLNDNTQLYPVPHVPDRLEAKAVHFIGRVRWIGRWMV